MANAQKLGRVPVDGKCSVCGEAVSADTGRCTGCGAVYGDAHRCPHCRSVADVERSDDLRFRCKVCGGPRVVVDDPKIERSLSENADLERAGAAHTRRTAWQMGSAVVAGFGGVSLLVALVTLSLVSPGFFLTTLALLMVAAPFVFSAFGFRKAKRAGAARDEALDRAWTRVAREVVDSQGALSAKRLAKLMRIDESQAELLMAQVSVDDFVRSRVEDLPAARQRIVADATKVADDEVASEAEQDEVHNEDIAARAKSSSDS